VPEYITLAFRDKLYLAGFQAGLAWITILRKRDAFRAAFEGFDPRVIATWGAPEVARLLGDAGIVRHRGKIESVIGNARAWIAMEARGGFDAFVWDHVGGKPLVNTWRNLSDIPASTDLSARVSKDLKKAGFRFCGPTIVYAWLQANGIVNDHLTGCFRHAEVNGLAR